MPEGGEAVWAFGTSAPLLGITGTRWPNVAKKSLAIASAVEAMGKNIGVPTRPIDGPRDVPVDRSTRLGYSCTTVRALARPTAVTDAATKGPGDSLRAPDKALKAPCPSLAVAGILLKGSGIAD